MLGSASDPEDSRRRVHRHWPSGLPILPQSCSTCNVRSPSREGSLLYCLLRRVAALYLVERIKNEVVSMAATHFQALAVGQARQRTIRRLARNPAGSSKPMSVSSCWSNLPVVLMSV